jgi:hypothetical protein
MWAHAKSIQPEGEKELLCLLHDCVGVYGPLVIPIFLQTMTTTISNFSEIVSVVWNG